ncbi:MAG TPA: SCO family protein [Thermoanaerobaculia bacterium]|nr:SCO family protein [Thermoanaerobaculia bacterium]HUM30101.1 SCO family protein [Thermoanaerobaculia bacterium]HXK68798.1 SCO family protein [Thermoanaerobaculia bacterium]
MPEVGIVEKLGDTIPLDATFFDESGNEVKLKEIIDKPTILSLVFYNCPGICGPLLNGESDVFDKVTLEPGKDFQLVTISFDPKDTPDLAEKKKANYLKTFTRPFPPEGWRFLTGTEENIHRVTDAVGFYYKKDGDNYLHAAALIALSPDGKIVRYIYGISFLPFDMKMAITEASEGRVGPTISRVLLFCFSYDPKGKTYVFNVLKVTGSLTMVFGAMFVIWLIVTTRRHRKKEQLNG